MRLLINAIPTPPSGGLTVLEGLLRGWQAMGADLQIDALAVHPGTVAALRKHDHVRVHVVSEHKQTPLRVLWQNVSFGRHVRRLGSDILLTNNHYLMNVPCPQIVQHHNVKRFLTPDLGVREPRSIANSLRDWAARQALRKADANVFVSDFLRRQAETFVPSSAERNFVVRNGLDDDVIEAAPSVPDAYAARFGELCAVQTANPHKDNPTMIRCLAELVRRAPDINWHLRIAGSDGRGSWLPFRELARSLGVEERITWCGFCNREELDQLLRTSLCLLATSLLEAGPLPGIESLARKCVPVGAAISPREEFVGEAALLVEPRNSVAFAEAVIRLHREPSLWQEMVERGLGRIQQFAWSKRAREFYEIILQVASGDGVHADRMPVGVG